MSLEHVVYVVDSAETSSLRTNLRTTVLKSLTCQYTVPLVCELLVHTEHVTDLTATNADITCRNVLVRTDVTIKLCHESLAETHNLCVASSTDREV